jgi:prevent-host-death family protein
MQTFNIHEAKTHLSRLIEMALAGEPFVIAKAGKPLVKVMALNDADVKPIQRLGFMASEMLIPNDFDRMGQAQVEQLFGGHA